MVDWRAQYCEYQVEACVTGSCPPKSQIVRDHLERCSSITADKINDCAALEHGDPFTSNDRDFVQYKTKFMRLYTAARRNHTRTTSGRDEGALATIMQQLRDMDVDEEDIARLTRDKADEAIEIIAEVRAYYQRMCITSSSFIRLTLH